MKLATIITTAPRPVPTLRTSLASYRSAGFTNPVCVLSDGDVCESVLDLDAHIVENDRRLGCLKNWDKALGLGIRYMLAEDYLLILQDDVLWAKDAYALLDLDVKPDGALSLYCPRRVSRHLHQKHRNLHQTGYYRSDLGWETWGAQAFMFPQAVARMLHGNALYRNYVATYAKNRNVDRIVPACLQSMGIPLHYRIPSLVNHDLGNANSSLGPKPVQPGLFSDHFAK